MALPLFAITLFVSAFLLFLVQPMIGKLILPRLGGTPQVWNTCMVFFQAALLAGYAYTHTTSTRLPLRRQLLVHALLLFIPFIVLLPTPYNISGFLPPPGANPIPYTLFHLSLLVGLPFLVVATSAPLLQKWFAATGHPASKDPYFLYGASNLGSMLALLAYPFLVEPNFPLRSTTFTSQAWIWTIGYGLLIILVLMCAVMVWKSPLSAKLSFSGTPDAPASEGEPGGPPPEPVAGSSEITAAPPAPAPAPPPPPSAAAKSTAFKKPPKYQPKAAAAGAAEIGAPRQSDELTPMRKLRWIALGAVPSSLMLGVTTHITTDLSPIPLIWLIPLTLYLLSFILVFSRWPVVWTEKPHTFMLYMQPVALALMILMDFIATPEHNLPALVFFLILGFFWTAMVCHGELARDRPGTKHLTEFYLLMSVGGVVGGIFNGLIAPILFPRVWEFSIAICVAGLVRPKMKDSGWTDDFVADMTDKPAPQPQAKKGKHQPHRAATRVEKEPSFHYTMDVALPGILLVVLAILAFALPRQIESLAGDQLGLMYFFLFGIPLIICCFYYGRPLRYGLGIGAVLLIHVIYTGQGRGTIYSARSYFGVIKVIQSGKNMPSSQGEAKPHAFTQLLHGTTDHGMNFEKPKDSKLWGNPLEDYSRLATTYYHQLGPAGRAMDKFKWWGKGETSLEKLNTYSSDARMPVSLIGMGAWPIGTANLPLGQLVDMWSEPPYATIGLGTGTMASYARPYQHCHFYEIDNLIRRLSLPPAGRDKAYPAGELYFNYLHWAKKRGGIVQVLMGDARLRMDQKYENFNANPDTGGGPDSFYHLMVVDAFSSDAIPVHLITKEAIQMYFKKLTRDGVLCVHTSNRHVNLVKVVADTAESITLPDENGEEKRLVVKRGHDNAPGDGKATGHYTSEWVMVARDPKYLVHLTAPDGYMEKLRAENERKNLRFDPEDMQYWTTPTPTFDGRYVWTDDYSNLIAVLR